MNANVRFFPSILFSLIAALACRGSEPPTKAQRELWLHTIVMDHLGDPKRPMLGTNGKVTLRDFAVNDGLGLYPSYVNAIRDNILKTGSKKVLFFIHGGMNVNSGAASRAAHLLPLYSFDGNYPIFICWDSPFYGDWEQALWVRAGKTERYGRGRTYSILTAPFQILADCGRAVTRLPLALSSFAFNDTYAVAPDGFTEHKVMVAEVDAYQGKPFEYDKVCYPALEPKLRIATQAGCDRRSTTQKVERDMSLLATLPLKIASHPIIDAVGVGAWNNMLRRTDTMFEQTPRYRTKNQPIPSELVKDKETGALGRFMDVLSGSDEICHGTEITLVGHSMGAIICNRIVAQYPKLNFRNIVYMAAACRVADFQTAVIPYMEKHESTEFFNLSLNPVCETGEMFKLDLAPRGSLLVWIDNIFGNPPSEQRRMLGIYQTALLSSHNIPFQLRPRVFYKAFNAVPKNEMKDWRGLIIEPQEHGDFAKGPFWERSFWSVNHKAINAARGPKRRTAEAPPPAPERHPTSSLAERD